MPAAKQNAAVGLAGRGGDLRGVKTGAGAYLAAAAQIAYQHAHRPVGLRLQDETALEFQRRAEQHGEHHGLAEQPGDWLRIIMARENGVDRRPEPHHLAAQLEGGNGERHDGIVGGELRRRAHRNGAVGIGHFILM